MPQTMWKNGIPKDGRSTTGRCTEAAPFTYCGVDIIGPLIIKERRSELKRYGAKRFPAMLSTLK